MSRVCFLVGSVAISGGTYVIFQHAAHLQAQGYDVTLAVQEPFSEATYAWHPDAKRLRIVDFPSAQPDRFDLVIATWWKTALALGEFAASRYAYFVQSIESRFYPEHEQPLRRLVDSTYELPVAFVTEVDWIRRRLRDHYAQSVPVVRNGVRKDLYFPDPAGDAAGRPLRVLVEGPFRVPFKNVGRTIQLVRKAGVRDLTLLTSSPVRWVPGVNRVHSRVPITMVPPIYRSCDVLVKLSTVEGMFGPPLEMFHCGGTAVVFDVSGFDEYIRHEHNALVARMGDDDAVVEHVSRLRRDPELLAALRRNALKTAESWPSWEVSSAEFEQWIESALDSAPGDREALRAGSEQAWRVYIDDEQARLRSLKQPGGLRRRARAFVAALPKQAVAFVEQANAVYETLR